MARLLRDYDYFRAIKSDQAMAQVIEDNWVVTKAIEQSAQAEMISYLAQRYKVKEIFTNTTTFDNTVVYFGKNLVEYTADAFSTAGSYTAGDRRVQSGSIYEANTTISAGPFDASQWDFICLDKTLFFAILPKPEYDPNVTYEVGDEVWYYDKIYTNRKRSKGIDPTFSEFWGTGTTYSFSGHLPDNTTYWQEGDNRNQQIVMYLLDIALYHLFSTINPRNVPDLRKERYNGNSANDSGGAIGWLKAVAHGNVEADLPEYTPEQGLSMRYGNAASFDNPSHNMMW